jgi:membrane-associated phospholipid phosphatase
MFPLLIIKDLITLKRVLWDNCYRLSQKQVFWYAGAMRQFIRKFINNLGSVFHWRHLPWHILAFGVTFIILNTGLDWEYFELTRFLPMWTWIPAGIVGGLLPILLPITLFIIARRKNNPHLLSTAQALTQAVILGSFTSSFYKFFTGRIPPDLLNTAVDISHGFQFGFGENGIFWGWPSSHTTIAFAMALTLINLYPNHKNLKFGLLAYALYVGFGASIGFHWLSEFAAGIIFGSLIGWIVGQSFKHNKQ